MADDRIGAKGWRSMLAMRSQLLAEYKVAKQYSGIHQAKVHHGNVAEHSFRELLIKFLPKRYGVTSGYIISQDIHENSALTEYDIIVYDQLNSPILWIEEGKKKVKAIPAEFVHGVFEVKSRFYKKSILDAVKKLQELKPFLDGVDEPLEPYKKYIPRPWFCCGIICYELLEEDVFTSVRKYPRSYKYLDAVIKLGLELPGFMGVIILEGDQMHIDALKSGKLFLIGSSTPIDNWGQRSSLFDEYGHGSSIKLGSKFHGLCVQWNENVFVNFLFDILARMKGTYREAYISSMYGFSYLDPNRKGKR